MKLDAKWIWAPFSEPAPYNHSIYARKRFEVRELARARIAITADSQYRLYINGRWVNDGPCRGFPEHYYYDEFDVTAELQDGENEVLVFARFFGVGTMHGIPQEPGLLVQLEAASPSGKTTRIVSDSSWEVAEASTFVRNTPKISLHMGPFEYYDARRELEAWQPAEERYAAGRGPWRGLQPRDCPLLTRTPVPFQAFREANLVAAADSCVTIPIARLLHPGVIEANMQTSVASAAATVICADKPQTLFITSNLSALSVNGKPGTQGRFALKRGKNLLLAVVKECFPFDDKELTISFGDTSDLRFENPQDPALENPWVFIPFPEGIYADTETHFIWLPHPKRMAIEASFAKQRKRILEEVHDLKSFQEHLAPQALCLPGETMLLQNPYDAFRRREVIGEACELLSAPGALQHDNAETTRVLPPGKDAVELVYDLGEQHCGYLRFELVAQAGLSIDIFLIEHIARDGRLQHTGGNRNGFRYECKEGVNRYTSTHRRSGRYVYITLRNQTRPAEFRLLDLVESTYPAVRRGSFECSDAALNRTWEISARTLELCMEDTFTDCPLYERVHWVGDMRNEALFAYGVFGAEDLARRCLRLAAQSLDRYPIVGAQVPSSLELIIPAWSFLWGIAVWEHYSQTGDRAFLEEFFPAVMKNLEGACKHRNEDGLFSAPYWNIVDWSKNDDRHETVLHNSILLVGAINAALNCAQVLDKGGEANWLKARRTELRRAVNRHWDRGKGAYPDSIHEDGLISPTISQHTSFLAYLHDVIPRKHREQAIRNMVSPPKEMVRVGSPFAAMFHYEALVKAGRPEVVLDSIRERYRPMLEAGATTVWENFPSVERHGGFPTRSHCHAWSSAPVYFFNRVVLGIRPTKAAGAAVDISPWVRGLDWARGSLWTINGPIAVQWERKGKRLSVSASGPDATRLRFRSNTSLESLEVFFNGRRVKTK